MRDEPVPVYGDGLNVRDWIHVRDHCGAIWRVWQEGPGRRGLQHRRPLRKDEPELTHALLDALGKPASLIRYVKDRPGHDRRYAIDCSQDRTRTGLATGGSFEQGCARPWPGIRTTPIGWQHIRSGDYLKYYEEQYGILASRG